MKYRVRIIIVGCKDFTDPIKCLIGISTVRLHPTENDNTFTMESNYFDMLCFACHVLGRYGFSITVAELV